MGSAIWWLVGYGLGKYFANHLYKPYPSWRVPDWLMIHYKHPWIVSYPIHSTLVWGSYLCMIKLNLTLPGVYANTYWRFSSTHSSGRCTVWTWIPLSIYGTCWNEHFYTSAYPQWEAIPQDDIRNILSSIGQLCQLSLLKGDHTQYLGTIKTSYGQLIYLQGQARFAQYTYVPMYSFCRDVHISLCTHTCVFCLDMYKPF